MDTSPNQHLHDSTSTAGRTLLRLVVGFLFAAHGWQKYFEWTIAGTQGAFADLGIPAAPLAAPAVATLELAGGVALMLGLLTRPVAALLALDMLGALVLVHATSGVFVANGGYELVLMLGAASAAVALLGAGPLSLDRLVFARRAPRATAASPASTTTTRTTSA